MNSIDRRIQEYQAQHDHRELLRARDRQSRTLTRLEAMLGTEAMGDLDVRIPDKSPGIWVSVPRRWWLPLEVFVGLTETGLELSKGPLAWATIETAEEFWLMIGAWK